MSEGPQEVLLSHLTSPAACTWEYSPCFSSGAWDMCVCMFRGGKAAGPFLPGHTFWGSSACLQRNVQICLLVAGLLGDSPARWSNYVGWLLLLWSVGILGRALICLLPRTFLKVLAVWGGGGTVRSRSLDRIPSGGLCSSVFAAFLPQRPAKGKL